MQNNERMDINMPEEYQIILMEKNFRISPI